VDIIQNVKINLVGRRQAFELKSGGTYSDHWALNGRNHIILQS